MIDSAEYVGPIDGLKGKKALVRPDLDTYELPLDQRKLYAQFDEIGLRHPATGARLGFDWHSFPAADFKILIRLTA
nr:hypothetical protein EVB34_075 [Rhizobium phage RHph_TM26]